MSFNTPFNQPHMDLMYSTKNIEAGALISGQTKSFGAMLTSSAEHQAACIRNQMQTKEMHWKFFITV